MDRAWVKLTCDLTPDDKITNRFLEDVTLAISPELRDLAYIALKPRVPGKKSFAAKLKSEIGRHAPNFLVSKVRYERSKATHPTLFDFWDLVFFQMGPRVWADYIDEQSLRDMMYRNPNSTILWNIATVELFAMTYCS